MLHRLDYIAYETPIEITSRFINFSLQCLVVCFCHCYWIHKLSWAWVQLSLMFIFSVNLCTRFNNRLPKYDLPWDISGMPFLSFHFWVHDSVWRGYSRSRFNTIFYPYESLMIYIFTNILCFWLLIKLGIQFFQCVFFVYFLRFVYLL